MPFPSEHFPLESSMCDAVAQEPGSNNLLVRFSAGKVYRYVDAASELSNVRNSESAGKYVNGVLKPNYTAERASEFE